MSEGTARGRRTGPDDRTSQWGTFLESLPDAALVLDPSGRIIAVNARAATLLGTTPEVLLGLPASDLLPGLPDDAQDAAPGSVLRATVRVQPAGRRPTGHGSPIEVSMAVLGRASTGVGLPGTAAVPDSGEAARILTLRETPHRAPGVEYLLWLVDTAPEATVITDQDGIITLVNAKAERLFGYRAHEMVGRAVEMLVPEHSRDKHVRLRAVHDTMSTSRELSSDLGLFARHKDGHVLPVEITLAPRHIGGTWVTAAAVRDVSFARAAEQEWRKAQEAVRAATQVRDRLLTLGRSVLVPGQNVVNALDALLETDPDGPRREYAENLRSRGTELLRALAELLTAAEAEAPEPLPEERTERGGSGTSGELGTSNGSAPRAGTVDTSPVGAAGSAVPPGSVPTPRDGTAPPPPSRVASPRVLRRLAEILGNRGPQEVERATHLVTAFHAKGSLLVSMMAAAADEIDPRRAAAHARSLRETAAQLDAVEVAALCSVLEDLAQSGALNRMLARLPRLVLTLEAFYCELVTACADFPELADLDLPDPSCRTEATSPSGR